MNGNVLIAVLPTRVSASDLGQKAAVSGDAARPEGWPCVLGVLPSGVADHQPAHTKYIEHAGRPALRPAEIVAGRGFTRRRATQRCLTVRLQARLEFYADPGRRTGTLSAYCAYGAAFVTPDRFSDLVARDCVNINY